MLYSQHSLYREVGQQPLLVASCTVRGYFGRTEGPPASKHALCVENVEKQIRRGSRPSHSPHLTGVSGVRFKDIRYHCSHVSCMESWGCC